MTVSRALSDEIEAKKKLASVRRAREKEIKIKTKNKIMRVLNKLKEI